VEEAPKPASHEGLHFSAFVDANYGFQTAKQGSPAPAHRAYEWNNFSTDAATGNSFSNSDGAHIVSLPFVVREVVPVLQEIGTEQEQAASTLGANAWQTFRRVTLPAIRWGVAYGVVLTTARVLGEFGAVSVVSGSISGETQTLPLFVEKQYQNFNLPGAFGASVLLALLALTTLLAMNLLKRKEDA